MNIKHLKLLDIFWTNMLLFTAEIMTNIEKWQSVNSLPSSLKIYIFMYTLAITNALDSPTSGYPLC